MKQLAKALKKKSGVVNLFSTGDRDKLENKHIPDSLAVLEFWEVQDGMKVLDLGTGGGLPGLALASSLEKVNFTLMDATQKKIRAVQEVADELKLSNVITLAGRCEELAHEDEYREKFDIVCARAVATLPTLLEYVSGFMELGATFYAWKSAEYMDELENSRQAQEILELEFVEAFEYSLPGGEYRSILKFRKIGSLEERFPRRTGVAKARPL